MPICPDLYPRVPNDRLNKAIHALRQDGKFPSDFVPSASTKEALTTKGPEGAAELLEQATWKQLYEKYMGLLTNQEGGEGGPGFYRTVLPGGIVIQLRTIGGLPPKTATAASHSTAVAVSSSPNPRLPLLEITRWSKFAPEGEREFCPWWKETQKLPQSLRQQGWSSLVANNVLHGQPVAPDTLPANLEFKRWLDLDPLGRITVRRLNNELPPFGKEGRGFCPWWKETAVFFKRLKQKGIHRMIANNMRFGQPAAVWPPAASPVNSVKSTITLGPDGKVHYRNWNVTAGPRTFCKSELPSLTEESIQEAMGKDGTTTQIRFSIANAQGRVPMALKEFFTAAMGLSPKRLQRINDALVVIFDQDERPNPHFNRDADKPPYIMSVQNLSLKFIGQPPASKP